MVSSGGACRGEVPTAIVLILRTSRIWGDSFGELSPCLIFARKTEA